MVAAPESVVQTFAALLHRLPVLQILSPISAETP